MIEKLLVPEGWKLVPVEPTPEMLTASYYPDCNAPKRKEIYRAMLSAAPVDAAVLATEKAVS